MDRRIYYICNFIDENFHEKLSVEHLAKKVYLSTSHFTTLFKKEINRLVELRLPEAVLLDSTTGKKYL